MIHRTDDIPIMPHDVECERWAVGSLMAYGDSPVFVAKTIAALGKDPKVFFNPDTQAIYRSIIRIHQRGQAFGALEVCADLNTTGVLEGIGGHSTLMTMMDIGRLNAGFTGTVDVIIDRFKRRRAWQAGYELANWALKPVTDETFDGRITKAMAALTALQANDGAVDVITASESAKEAIEQARKPGGIAISTGYGELDAFSVLFKSAYSILAGRPSMGKSTLAKCLLVKQADGGRRVGLISVEESRVKVGQNLISNGTDLDSRDFFSGNLTEQEFARAEDFAERIKALPFWIVDSLSDIADVLNAIDVLVLMHQCEVIAIDHLHCICDRRESDGERKIAGISLAIKNAAVRHKIAILQLAQFNRANEGREDHIPKISDLRGSGAIEEHADAIMILHREDYYHRNDDPRAYTPDGLADLIIAKNRNGPPGQICLRADLAHMRFEPWQESSPY